MKYALYSDRKKIQDVYEIKSVAGELYNNSFYGYLSTPEARVRYAMATVSRFLADSAYLINNSKIKEDLIQVRTGNDPSNWVGILYLWTALMVFVRQHHDKPIAEDSIWIIGNETIFNNQFKAFMGLKWYLFSKSSLYETEFKTCLTPQMLEISSQAPFFEDISGELPLDEQTELWLQYCSNDHTPVLQNDIKEEEKFKHSLEHHLSGLLIKLYNCNKNITNSIQRCYSGAVSEHRKSPQFQTIDKLLKGLCLSKDIVLHDADLHILHYGVFGTVIKDWEKLSSIAIDSNFSKKITHVLNDCRGAFAYRLGLLYEGDRDEQNALNYYRSALRQGSIEAINLFKERGEKNDAGALYHLAIDYHHPRGEILEAVCLCLKAVELGSSEAKTYIEKSEFSEILQIQKENHSIDPDIPEESKEEFKEEEPIDTDSFKKNSEGICKPLDLARNYESPIKHHPKARSKAFRAYFASARSGNREALDALERLAPVLSTKKQMALSELYTGFFDNNEKAGYWQKKSSESKPFPFIDAHP